MTTANRQTFTFKNPENKNTVPKFSAIEVNTEGVRSTDKTNKEEKPKTEKIKIPRLKLDEKTLLYGENGMKKFYEIIDKTEFKERSSDTHNLHKLVMLFKNWHFLLFPKYDVDFFISKITDLGRKPSSKAYMSRLRKIYKGEENWDVLYTQQDEILANPHLAKANAANKENMITNSANNKIFQEDSEKTEGVSSTNAGNINFNFNFNMNKSNLNSQMNRISDKFNNVEITNNTKKDTISIDNNNRDETDVQELNFQNIENNENEEMPPDYNEKDFDHFDHFYEKNEINSNPSLYKREKRLYSEAFSGVGEENMSVAGSSHSQTSKKKKML